LYNNFYTWIDWINKFTNLIITNTINITNEKIHNNKAIIYFFKKILSPHYYVITFENKIEKQYIYKVKKQTIILAMHSK